MANYILSVSRRTDIPAFYIEWFIKRLKEGYLFVRHPYTGEYFYVSLKPENILGIVFWSKDYSKLLQRLQEIEGVTHRLFFHFTITGLPQDIETNAPPYLEAVKDFLFIARRYSPRHIIWRFDPICITDKIPFEYHLEAFRRLAEMLRGYCYTCYISFVNPYYKVIKNLERYTLHRLLDISYEEKRRYAEQLVDVAKQYGIRIYACCNDYLLPDEKNPLFNRGDKVQKGSCINRNYLARIWDIKGLDYEPPSPTRKECACTKSIDIGAYNTCPHGCIYCYANTDKEDATVFYKDFNPDWKAMDTDMDAILVKNP